MAVLFELRKDLETAADMVNQIEAIRSQLASITALLDPAGAGGPTRTSEPGADRGPRAGSPRGVVDATGSPGRG
ncbi:MAG TPA: hypothetical protein DHU55_03080, partial [Blastocatellia bacterium]|nr:hypothetical protein [Blastocatellia bacterium]